MCSVSISCCSLPVILIFLFVLLYFIYLVFRLNRKRKGDRERSRNVFGERKRESDCPMYLDANSSAQLNVENIL